jgi:hypothetical protein
VTGVAFGIATWMKPAGEFLFLAALPALLFATRNLRRTLVGSGVVALALLVTISPWIVRNVVKFDLYSMSNQGNESLFHRVFHIDRMPIPRDVKYGDYAQLLRERIAAQRPTRTVITYDFHYGAIEELGLSSDQARSAEGKLAVAAIRRNLGAYLSGTRRELGRAIDDVSEFEGEDRLLAELGQTDPPVGRATTTAIWDAVRPLYDVWWLLSLSTAAGLLAVFTGPRRSRNAAAALLSVWAVVAFGTAMAVGAEWRYSIQVAPIAWMLASAGVVTIVSSVAARLSRDRA